MCHNLKLVHIKKKLFWFFDFFCAILLSNLLTFPCKMIFSSSQGWFDCFFEVGKISELFMDISFFTRLPLLDNRQSGKKKAEYTQIIKGFY